jgi:hypothetical protein
MLSCFSRAFRVEGGASSEAETRGGALAPRVRRKATRGVPGPRAWRKFTRVATDPRAFEKFLFVAGD